MTIGLQGNFILIGLIHVKPEVTVNATLFRKKSWGGQHRRYFICVQGGPERQKNLGLAKKMGGRRAHNDVFEKAPLYRLIILDI